MSKKGKNPPPKSFGSSDQLGFASFLDKDDDSTSHSSYKGHQHKAASHSTGYAGPCHLGHKEWAVGPGMILGANCSRPREGYDIYVGLDHTMADMRGYPWHDGKSDVQDIHFPIQDMGVPKDAEDFKAMVTWLCNQLHEGKRVHVGCIGGHGRTGMVLAAIVSEGLGRKDAIQHMRSLHCPKGVESKSQVEFLMKHYGMDHALGAKESVANPKSWLSKSDSGPRDHKYSSIGKASATVTPLKPSNSSYGGKAKAYRPFKGQKTIWSET